MVAGGPIILGRLLKKLPQGSYSLITNTTGAFFDARKINTWLPCNYYFIDQGKPYPGNKLNQLSASFKSEKNVYFKEVRSFSYIQKIKTLAQKIHNKNKQDAILVVSDNGIFLIGAYLAAQATKLPLFIYLFDLYADNALPWHIKLVAKFFEPILFRRAERIFVTNRHTKEYLLKKYHFRQEKFVVCPNIGEPVHKVSSLKRKKLSKKSIVFTGNVYWAQINNLKNLIAASKNIPNFEVKIFSPKTQDELKQMGLVAAWVVSGTLNHQDSILSQEQADLLFLPMDFGKSSQAIVKTASPGKLVEYLDSGRPIFVHAPAYSQISRYAREEGFGLVVDRQDPKALRKAILRLLGDSALRKKLVKNAKSLLKNEFDQKKIQKRFIQALDGQ